MLPVIRNNQSPLAASPVNRLATLFDRFFNDPFFTPLAATPTFGGTMPASMWEDEEAIHVEIDMPGVTEKEIELTIENGELLVRGERKVEEKRGGYDTRSYGQFEHRVTLPITVDSEKVDAKLVNGVLSIVCPKSETAKPRKIAIAAPKSE